MTLQGVGRVLGFPSPTLPPPFPLTEIITLKSLHVCQEKKTTGSSVLQGRLLILWVLLGSRPLPLPHCCGQTPITNANIKNI